MKQTKTFWLSFDLGIRGDYNNLYKWLDKNEAIACGNNLAFIKFHYQTADPKSELEKSLKDDVKFNQNDQIYLVWSDDENKTKGRFIVGGRKPAPWKGYHIEETTQEIDF